MKKSKSTNSTGKSVQNEGPDKAKSGMNRRQFVGLSATAALGFTIVPRNVLGGPNYIAPSDKINLAYIGIGTQGLREMLPMLAMPEIQIVAICDPSKEARGYKDWAPMWLQSEIRKAINKPDWNPGGDNQIPGGRENGKNIVETYYANVSQNKSFKGCTAYADARELLEKEKGIDAVKIMTPDHLHGVLAAAAIRKGKHVIMHKPISNRLLEAQFVIDLARKNNNVITHLVPWDSNGSMDTVMSWINSGAIGTLKEVHNWSNRPVWPQYSMVPTDNPPVPEGFDWDLWLGPESERPYHPNYTHMVFRGWYDFGGGAMADMGHYSLWTVFNALKLTSPTIIEPHRTNYVDFKGAMPSRVNNNFAFPVSNIVRFKFPSNGSRRPVDLYWYDGGMRPSVPDEMLENNKELPEEGMMFVGDNGKILAGPNVQDPQIVSGKNITATSGDKSKDTYLQDKKAAALPTFVQAVKSGKQYPGSFPEAEYLTETINLYGVALRTNKVLTYNATNKSITNVSEANNYLQRPYRAGWDVKTI
ncbi:MAG: Gfo/Idh/MocA family oxidoreductase [Bacteroidales bacterium]|nr:Gfo/Idh/MocA family oxidoreductase [Bacteroidales bacterium]